MKRAAAMAMALLMLILWAVPGSAAQDNWSMVPDKDRTLQLEELQDYLSGLTPEGITNMQVVYGVAQGTPPADTRVDRSRYSELLNILKKMKLVALDKANPVTGNLVTWELAVTANGETVGISPLNKSWIPVSGSLGHAAFGTSDESWKALSDAIDALPGVAEAVAAADRTVNDYFTAQGSTKVSPPTGTDFQSAVGKKGVLNPRKSNPAVFSVDFERNVDYINIYGGGYYYAITDRDDQVSLVNYVNALNGSGKTDSVYSGEFGTYRLEFRMKNGSKHEYTASRSGNGILADGQFYLDSLAAHFDGLMKSITGRGRLGAAWLGYMNSSRITAAEWTSDGVTRSTTAKENAQEIQKVARTLKEYSPKREGGFCRTIRGTNIAPELVGKSPVKSYRLTFDSGVVYTVNFYNGGYCSVKSSDMDYWYLYN